MEVLEQEQAALLLTGTKGRLLGVGPADIDAAKLSLTDCTKVVRFPGQSIGDLTHGLNEVGAVILADTTGLSAVEGHQTEEGQYDLPTVDSLAAEMMLYERRVFDDQVDICRRRGGHKLISVEATLDLLLSIAIAAQLEHQDPGKVLARLIPCGNDNIHIRCINAAGRRHKLGVTIRPGGIDFERTEPLQAGPLIASLHTR